MQVRFQADADLNVTILHAMVRCEPALDFQTAHTAGLEGRADIEVLAIAAQQGRILVTHDQKTMARNFAQFIDQQVSSGVLVVPQHLPVSLVVDELLLIWGASEAEEWMNRISYLPL